MQNEEISGIIFEFYNTTDENLRKYHLSTLNSLQEHPDWLRRSLMLIQPNFPPVVQFYAAKSLFDLLNKKFDLIVENPEMTNEIREFYVQKLTEGAHSLPHSLLNILSSGLAVFLMKCLPDIWPNPFLDLINVWSSKQELLLRVFAEVGAEFPRIYLPPKQRNILRLELLKASQGIAQIAHVVLSDPELPPSLKNAAVECVELWLKLPGAKISDFLSVFTSVFDNVSNDIVALSRILSTLKVNEELPNLPNLIKQITHFVAFSIVPLLSNEINTVLCKEGLNFSDELTDIIPLICSVAEFVYTFIHKIVGQAAEALGTSEQNSVTVYFTICDFFAQLSTIKGLYPVKECVSDLLEPVWYGLREELMHVSETEPYANKKTLLRQESVKYFLQILQSAIEKIAYFPDVETMCDKSQLERFESYRITRADVSINAIQIAPSETISLLTTLLNDFLDKQDICQSESTLYYFCEAADFLTDNLIFEILPTIYKTNIAKQSLSGGGWIKEKELVRFGQTLMSFLQKIEHFIITSLQAGDALPKIIAIIIDFMHVSGVDSAAIDALIAYVKNRDSILQVAVDLIISKCYEYFNCESHEKGLRLNAIRCMGIVLSMKPNAFILSSLDQFLTPRLISLKKLISTDCSLSMAERESQILFELSVLAQLVATLEVNNKQVLGNLMEEGILNETNRNLMEEGILNETNCGASTSTMCQQSPVRLIIDQCISFFNIVLTNTPIPSQNLVTKVCDVLRAGLLSLHLQATPLIDTYLNYLDLFLFRYPNPACDLSKTLFLTYRSDVQVGATLFARLTRWYSEYCSKFNEQQIYTFSERDEKFLELAHYVLKKNWLCIESLAKNGGESIRLLECFLQSVCFSAIKNIELSRDASLMQESFRVLVLIIKKYSASDNKTLQNAIKAVSQIVLPTVFLSIQSDMCNPFVALIAEILFHFTDAHPDLARQIVAKLPGGNSQLVGAMFSQNLSFRNFRLRVSQMHQASLKQLS